MEHMNTLCHYTNTNRKIFKKIQQKDNQMDIEKEKGTRSQITKMIQEQFAAVTEKGSSQSIPVTTTGRLEFLRQKNEIILFRRLKCAYLRKEIVHKVQKNCSI